MRKLAVIAIFLAITVTTPAAACHSWLTTWRNHSGLLPNSSRFPTGGAFTPTWSATANFGSGNQTVSGTISCGGSNGAPSSNHDSCWCRRTTTEGQDSWSRNTSSIRGNRREDCSGNRSIPCIGPWVFAASGPGGEGDDNWCEHNCASVCSGCVHYGASVFCTRAEILQ